MQESPNPHQPLIKWYHQNHRPLPWRETRDPYKIWISEIILQQTRVAQGLDYFNRFVERFPTVQDLANASEDEVMKYWEGLGYYSRARNLHFSAKEIAFDRKGIFPEHYTEWLKLKGVGPYTARAIGSLAYGNKTGVLDGNVFRVLTRYLADASPIDVPATRKKFQKLLDEWIQKADPADFNQAMMELGALVCTPRNPDCEACPLSGNCRARALENQLDFPVKAKKLKRKTKYFHFFLYQNQNGELLVQKRPSKGLWAGLWEVPNQEVAKEAWEKESGDRFLGGFKHVFTHFDMMVRVYEKKALPPGTRKTYSFKSREELRIFAFSKAVLIIFERFLPKIY